MDFILLLAALSFPAGAQVFEASPGGPQPEPPAVIEAETGSEPRTRKEADKERRKEEKEERNKEKKDKEKESKEAFKLRLELGIDLSYDDNVYNLDSDNIKDLEKDDEPNNRFDRMRSADDFLARGLARLKLGWRGFKDREMGLTLEARGTKYFLNEFKDYLDFNIELSHEVWKHGEAFLELDYIPSRFKKNYFENGIDINADGEISKSERVYDHGIYWEFELLGGLRSQIIGDLSGEFALGVRLRDYKSPFRNRDQGAFLLELELEYELWDRIVFGFQYNFESELTGNGRENVLINENIHGDVDGIPGLDPHALTRTSVDRSNLTHELVPSIEIRLTKRLSLELFYRYQFQEFTSGESLDLNHHNREDQRYTVGGEIEYQLADWAELSLRYVYIRNLSDRRGDDPVDEERTFTRNVVSLGLLLSF